MGRLWWRNKNYIYYLELLVGKSYKNQRIDDTNVKILIYRIY